MSGREIADRLGQRSHDGVRKSLARLVAQGVVRREGSRSAYMHVLNGEHLATPAVRMLADMRSALWMRLRVAILAWDVSPVHASAFGSAARGDGDEHSDIDLFVVRPRDVDEGDGRWAAQIERLRTEIADWTGNRAGIVEQGEESLDRLLARSSPPRVLRDIARDAVDLAGIPSRQLLGNLHGSSKRSRRVV
jgi:predicted nucleotidyltransferase